MRRPAAVLLVLLTSCVGREPRPATDAALPPPPPAFQTCHEACTSLRARHCVAGQPDEDGEPCEIVCTNAEAFRQGLFLQAAAEPSCVVNR